MGVPEGTATEEQVDGKKEKKKKGKKDETKDEAGDLGFEVIDDEEVGGTVKTAAQKKKEKKERQMQKERKEKEGKERQRRRRKSLTNLSLQLCKKLWQNKRRKKKGLRRKR